MNRGLHKSGIYFETDPVCVCTPRNSKFKGRTKSEMCSIVFDYSNLKVLCSTMFVSMVVLLLVQNSHGFNLDVQTRVEIDGPNPGSYFGYSVAMLNQPPDHKWILIGAPKDNSIYMPNTTNPGAIYKCTVFDEGRGHACEELFVDDDKKGQEVDSADYNGINRVYINGRDNQWLGVSLDVHPDSGVVTCASRWFNRYYEKEDYFFMNGLCYQIPVDLNQNYIIKIPALVDANKQTQRFQGNVTKINYGMGNLGGSVHFTEEGQDLLLGAPGLRTWTGGFIDMRGNKGHITDYAGVATEISELAGYAMTSGNFFGNGNIYYAIGAPREELTGKVLVYRGNQDNFIYENTDAVLDGSESTTVGFMPVNSFYGSALASVDVNNDGIDDLLVGAPFYTKGSVDDHKSYEEGLVMVYLGQSNFRFKVQENPLTGNKAVGARFGTAISSLGDLNKDKYNDVIIGAPYEDDMQGAVYIYNGCKTGVWRQYTQRIPASEMSRGLKSFGISLSRPVDMNDDNVNDIAIGAYLSDKVFLLYGQSIINIDISIATTVDLIDKDTKTTCTTGDGKNIPCFGVEVCFYYVNRAYGTIDILHNAYLDTYMEEFPRIVWQVSGTNALGSAVRIFSGETSCSDVMYALIKSTSDLVTPVMIKADYVIGNIPTVSYVKPTLNKFRGDSPNKNLVEATYLMDFKKECPDNDCRTDLHVQSELMYDKTGDENYFVIGSQMIFIHVTIEKSGDPSYGSNLFITMPKSLQYQKVYQFTGDTEVNCGFVEEDSGTRSVNDNSEETDNQQSLQNVYIPEYSEDELMLICSFGNPLYNNTGVRFHVYFVVPDSITDSELKFRLNATTLSTETNPDDNVETLTVQVKNKVTTTFYGVSRPSYITVDDTSSSYKADHVYELRNKGPSPLPSAFLTLQYPQVQSGGKAQVYLNKTAWSCSNPCQISCSLPDHSGAPTVYAEEVGPTYYVNESPSKDRVAESRELASISNVDCTRSTCSRYECELKNIPPRESAVVSMEFVISGSLLSVYAENQVVTVRSDAYVSFGDQNRLESPATEHFTDVLTDIYPLSPPPKTVAWWIILISVLGGVLLILLIVFILWKIGFFKRKQMEQMKLMQHEGEVEKMVPEEADANGTEKA